MRPSATTTLIGTCALALAAAIAAPGCGDDESPPTAAPSNASSCAPARAERRFTPLWNGRDLSGWRQAGPGGFDVVGGRGGRRCALRSRGGLGLLWYARRAFFDFVLRLEWRAASADDNSGVFVRFPRPGDDPFVAVREGYEVQIYDGRGETQATGSIYDSEPPEARNSRPPGHWNRYAIRVAGEPARITVRLNGRVVQRFRSSDPGRAPAPGYVGIQNHSEGDVVAFRAIRVRELRD